MFIQTTIINLKLVPMSVQACVERSESLTKVRVLTSFFLVEEVVMSVRRAQIFEVNLGWTK
jgi:hypothetical protein